MLPVPPRLKFHGNTHAAKQFKRLALSQLEILKKQMSFQGLKQGVRRVSPFEGVFIECVSKFGLHVVNVFVSSQKYGGKEYGKGDQQVDRYKKYTEYTCLCLPHFTIGIVLSITPEYPIRENFEFEEAYINAVASFNDFMLQEQFECTVAVCNGNNMSGVYIAYINGWEYYTVGEYVIVTIGDKMNEFTNPLDCNRSCLMDSPQFEKYSIAPITFLDHMDQLLIEQEYKRKI
jgi:hypothetical protein